MPSPIRLAGLVLALGALLAGCRRGQPEVLLGSLEWDRVGVPAELSEPIRSISVTEGAVVKAGELLLTLDARRTDARLAQAEANIALERARLDEALHGARVEELDAARADLASTRASVVEAQKQYARFAELGKRELVAKAVVDNQRATRDRALAQQAAAQAKLAELTSGTRAEDIAQAEAALAAATSARDALQLDRKRLEVRAPRDGRVDALPFRAGDQPPAGATVASLLVGTSPYARVFVPSSVRAGVREGQDLVLRVQGSDRDWHAKVRSIARDPSFTPYYALTGDDASRLVYRAELLLTDAGAAQLPAGLPVQVSLPH
jgi:HlyD family secretion protein